MADYKSTINELSNELIQSKLECKKSDFEILKVYIEFSTLYEEVKILFSFKKKTGFFYNRDSLRVFRYDKANDCGVLAAISGENDNSPRTIRTFGNESILSDKGWI